MKILILKVSAIGDVIHTLPSIFLIKKIIPEAKISWVIQKKAANLINGQPFLEKAWVLPDKFLKPKNWKQTWSIIKKIKKIKWDLIIDFQGIIKTSILLSFLKGNKTGFDKNNARWKWSSLFVNKTIKPNWTNIIQKNLSLTSQSLINQHNSCPFIENLKSDFFLDFKKENKKIVNNWILTNNLTKYIILAPNTTWPAKHWTTSNLQELLHLLNQDKIKTILIGKTFGYQANILSNYVKIKKLNVIVAPAFNLLQIAYLISKSKLTVAPDTGILHLADFLNKKTIAIFGPTNATMHGPYLNINNIRNKIQLNCSHNFKKYSIKNSDINKHLCMQKLSAKKLLAKILKNII